MPLSLLNMSAAAPTVSLSSVKIRSNRDACEMFANVNEDITYIELQPFWQRKYECWNAEMKTRLIETLLQGRHMNPIWVVTNPEDGSECVLDGMHRLMTCIAFMNNDFELTKKYLDNTAFANKTFKTLEVEHQSKIKNYPFAWNILDTSYYESGEKRAAMYKVLNRSNVQLNDFEFNKNNYHQFYNILAEYTGQLDNTLFKKKKDKRGEEEYQLLIMYILITSQKASCCSSLNHLRIKWENEHLKSESGTAEFLDKNETAIRKELDFICKLCCVFDDTHEFYTGKFDYLVHQFIVVQCSIKFKKNISLFYRYEGVLIKQFKEKLLFVDDICEVVGAKSKGGRNAHFQKELLRYIGDLIDSIYDANNPENNRQFPKPMIEQQYKEQDGKCIKCGKSKSITEFQADHIKSWCNGGMTSLDNLQLLCVPCHKVKTKAD